MATSSSSALAAAGILAGDYAATEKYIRQCLLTNTNLMLRGLPGVGKTTMMHDIAGSESFEVVETRLQYMQATDIKFPFIKDGRYSFVIPEDWPFNTQAGRRILWLWDELPNATPDVFNAMLEVAHERRLGIHNRLSDDVVIMATGNSLGDRANINQLPSPLVSRFAHILLDAASDEKGWFRWAIANNIHFTIADYFKSQSSKLFSFKAEVWTPDTPFVCPRTAEYTSKALQKLEITEENVGGRISEVQTTASMLMGPAAGGDVAAYAEFYKAITPMEEIIKNPNGARLPENTALSVWFAQSGMLGRHTNINNLEPVLKYIERWEDTTSAAADYQGYALQLMLKNEKAKVKETIQNTAFWGRWASKNAAFWMTT